MHCGCPLPGDTIGQRLERLTSRLTFAQLGSGSALSPPHHPDALSATHPSEHNCVDGTADKKRADQIRQKRIAKVTKRRERDAKLVEKGKMDRRQYDRGMAHEYAFLYPVPFYYPPVIGCGAFPIYAGVGSGLGGCAVEITAAINIRFISSGQQVRFGLLLRILTSFCRSGAKSNLFCTHGACAAWLASKLLKSLVFVPSVAQAEVGCVLNSSFGNSRLSHLPYNDNTKRSLRSVTQRYNEYM